MMQYVLITVYVILLFLNILQYANASKRNRAVVIALSFILLFFLMCGHKYTGLGDAGDFLQYKSDYENIARRNYFFHYLFYVTEDIGLFLGLSFYQWWAVMTIASFIVLSCSAKKFNLDIQFFLIAFMSYYVIMLYGGLKFYYGFCLLQMAVGYLIRGKRGDKIRYALFVAFAGGFHFMYYLYIIFVIIGAKKQKNLVKVVVATSLLFSIYILLNGKNIPFIGEILSLVNDNKIEYYLSSTTNYGYILPIAMQLVSLFYTWEYRKLSRKGNNRDLVLQRKADTIFYSNLMMTLFYPLFMLSLTFMRLVTAYSLTTIYMSSSICEMDVKKRRTMLMGAMIIVGGYWVYNLFFVNYLQYILMPFFDSYFFNWMF